jgi:hypothetical protein
MPVEVQEAQRLQALFTQRALMSQRAFGEKHGIGSPAMVWQYLTGGRKLNLRAACRFARGLGVDLALFSPRLAAELEELVSMGYPALPDAPQRDYVQIPCVTLTLKNGVPGFGVGPLLPSASFIAFRRDWMASKGYSSEHLLAVECNDRGMVGSIAEGDLVVLNTADTSLEDGSVYAINYEGRLRIRRIFRDAGSWWLHCDNQQAQRYPRKQFVRKQCFSIGRVVHKQSEFI